MWTILSKMYLKLIVFLTLGCVISATAQEVDYSEHKKYVIEHNNEVIYDRMVNLQMKDDFLDFWLLSRNMSIVVVPPNSQNNFQQELQQMGAAFNVLPVEATGEEDREGEECVDEFCSLTRTTRQAGFFRSYQRYSTNPQGVFAVNNIPFEAEIGDDDDGFEDECSDEFSCSAARSIKQSGFFKNYQTYETILQFMKFLARRFPSHVRYISIGRSLEGRTIGGLYISLGRSRRGRRLAYIQGGAHAREWITEPTVLYFATQIAVNVNKYRNILRNIDLVVVPCLNPDGYEYTHTTDRYWRKNRRNNAGSCRGVDVNRNFGVQWNTAGASSNPCSEVYAGRGPFSEVETQAARRFLQSVRGRLKLVLDVHSFGNFLFYPWGFSKRISAPTRRTLHAAAARAAAQIYKYRGTAYKIGTSADILYEASGGMDDYAYGGLGVPLSYTVELPGKGFEVSPSQIIPIGKETFGGFLEFVRIATVI